jgi:hypothetical protein
MNSGSGGASSDGEATRDEDEAGATAAPVRVQQDLRAAAPSVPLAPPPRAQGNADTAVPRHVSRQALATGPCAAATALPIAWEEPGARCALIDPYRIKIQI